MTNPCSLDIKKAKNRFLKQLTVGLFFVLPVKITNVFVSLSIISLIMKLRKLDPGQNQTLVNKIGELLKIKLSEDIFLLPQQTFSWYWTPTVLNTHLHFDGEEWTLSQLLSDRESFMKHRNTVMNILLDSLPSAIKLKLGLYSLQNRMEMKHRIISVIQYV